MSHTLSHKNRQLRPVSIAVRITKLDNTKIVTNNNLLLICARGIITNRQKRPHLSGLPPAIRRPQKPPSCRKMCNFVKGTRTRTLTLGRAPACFRLPPTKTMGDTAKPTIARRGGSKALGSSLVPISLLPVRLFAQDRSAICIPVAIVLPGLQGG